MAKIQSVQIQLYPSKLKYVPSFQKYVHSHKMTPNRGGIILIINILKKKDKILKVRCDKSNIAMDMELF